MEMFKPIPLHLLDCLHACSTQAAEEARREADARAQEAEKELEERREEVRGLEDRLRKAEEESSHSKARLDAFTKAMGSLQDDRDRVLGMYKQLEEKHLQVKKNNVNTHVYRGINDRSRRDSVDR